MKNLIHFHYSEKREKSQEVMNMTHPNIEKMEKFGEMYPKEAKAECAYCGQAIAEEQYGSGKIRCGLRFCDRECFENYFGYMEII